MYEREGSGFVMMPVMTKEEVFAITPHTSVQCILYLKSYELSMTKGNKPFMKGCFYSHGQIDFKAWDSSKAYEKLKNNNHTGVIVQVQGTVDEYNHVLSLIVEDYEVIPESDQLNYFMFLDDVYDVQTYWGMLNHMIHGYCSDNGMKVFQIVMNDAQVRDAFRLEFAAVKHHDSCKSGLLAHTTKVVQHVMIFQQYPRIWNEVGPDLLILGAALHDIGKCVEYHHGAMSEIGEKVSHLTYGCLIVSRYEQQITALMGADFYYHLLSIISQHHGPFADSPRTLGAYVIHLLDLLDTNLTDIETQLRDDKLLDVKTPIVVRDIGKIKY